MLFFVIEKYGVNEKPKVGFETGTFGFLIAVASHTDVLNKQHTKSAR